MTVDQDILARAERVLETGQGLNESEILEILLLPDDRIPDLLDLAHRVRMRWCGPEVEVEGIVSLKTGGCPEDCHFCSQSGLFPSPSAPPGSTSPAWLTRPSRPLPPAPPNSASSLPSVGRTSGS